MPSLPCWFTFALSLYVKNVSFLRHLSLSLSFFLSCSLIVMLTLKVSFSPHFFLCPSITLFLFSGWLFLRYLPSSFSLLLPLFLSLSLSRRLLLHICFSSTPINIQETPVWTFSSFRGRPWSPKLVKYSIFIQIQASQTDGGPSIDAYEQNIQLLQSS